MNTTPENSSIICSTVTNFSKLESLFSAKIIFLSHRNFIKNVKNTVAKITDQPMSEPVALLIKTDHQQSTIKKLGLFLYTSIQFQYLKFKVSKIPGTVMTPYGIYPKIDKPFAIYQLNTSAERYTNANILTTSRKGLKGLLSRILTFITQYHASTAGIVLLVYKKS